MTLFGITGHFTASIAQTPSPLPKHYSIPRTSFLVKAEVSATPRNRSVLNKKPAAVDASRVSLSGTNTLIEAANEVAPARVANLGCRPDSISEGNACS